MTEAGEEVRERDATTEAQSEKCDVAGVDTGVSQECRRLQQLEKARGQILAWGPQKGAQPCQRLALSPETPVGPLPTRTVRSQTCCVLSH